MDFFFSKINKFEGFWRYAKKSKDLKEDENLGK